MTRDEIVVAVIDLEPPGDMDPSPTQRSAPDGPRDVIEGGLLVAVGLATLVVEGLARAIVAAIGDHLPPAGGPADEDEEDKPAAGSPEAETLAMIAGAGLGIAFGTARFATRMVAGIDRVIRPFSLVAMIPPVDRAARRLERSAIQLNEGWRDERLESQRVAEAFADALVPDLVDAIIDRLDLTTLVLERVDLDQVAGSLEMSELIERVDLDAAVARVDLDADHRTCRSGLGRGPHRRRADHRPPRSRSDRPRRDRRARPPGDHPGLDRDDGCRNARWRPRPRDAGGPVRVPSRRPGAPARTRRTSARVGDRRGLDRGPALSRPAPDGRVVQGDPAGLVSRVLAASIDLAATLVAVLLFYLGLRRDRVRRSTPIVPMARPRRPEPRRDLVGALGRVSHVRLDDQRSNGRQAGDGSPGCGSTRRPTPGRPSAHPGGPLRRVPDRPSVVCDRSRRPGGTRSRGELEGGLRLGPSQPSHPGEQPGRPDRSIHRDVRPVPPACRRSVG